MDEASDDSDWEDEQEKEEATADVPEDAHTGGGWA